jgi:CheY-like chemotaxis protein
VGSKVKSGWDCMTSPLKNDPQTRDIPIIGMSAHALASNHQYFYARQRGNVDRSSMISKHRLASEQIVDTGSDRWWRSGGDIKSVV